jgi:hypothetical protein
MITWTTRDGRTLKLSEMTDDHLRNTIAMLRNKASSEIRGYWQAGCMLQGEMSIDAWESALDSEMERTDLWMNIADAMEKELRRRP